MHSQSRSIIKRLLGASIVLKIGIPALLLTVAIVLLTQTDAIVPSIAAQGNNIPPDANATSPRANNIEPVPVSTQGITVTGFTEIPLREDGRTMNIQFVNDAANPCDFRYQVFLANTGQLICETGLIPPGKAIIDPQLTVNMPKGDTDAIIKLDTYSVTDGTPMNGAEMPTVIKFQ